MSETSAQAASAAAPAASLSLSSAAVLPPMSSEDIRKIVKLQAVVRSFLTRRKVRTSQLRNAWRELDVREEKELAETHSAYEEMKQIYEDETSFPMPTTLVREVSSFEDKVSAILRAKATMKGPAASQMDLGPLDNKPLTLDPFVTQMIDHFKQGRTLQYENAFQLVRRCFPLIQPLPNIVHININAGAKMNVVGDIHGQLGDLLTIFKLSGLPSERNMYLFNGDIVDRGANSCECLFTILAFKLLYPEAVFINRGNHEARDINGRDGFERECLTKYDRNLYDMIEELFTALPLGAVVQGKYFVVHGGVPSNATRDAAGKCTPHPITIEELQKINRFHMIPPSRSVMEELLWSDPHDNDGCSPNDRGAGLMFGPDVCRDFMARNNLQLVMRSHECVDYGYEEWYNNTLFTVFSASNYTGSQGNEGAYCIMDTEHEPQFVCYMAYEPADIPSYSMQQSKLEEELVAKLLLRIAEARLALLAHWLTVSKDGTRITRKQWANGLQTVLQLKKLPFLQFQSFLGLPDLGVGGEVDGPIDFHTFLARFRPVHDDLSSSEPAEESAAAPSGNQAASEGDRVKRMLSDISEMLFRKRIELTSLFRFCDVNGDGMVSPREFKAALKTLRLQNEYSDADLDLVVKQIDKSNTGKIDYQQFFEQFRLANPDFVRPALKRRASLPAMAAERTPTLVGVLRARYQYDAMPDMPALRRQISVGSRKSAAGPPHHRDPAGSRMPRSSAPHPDGASAASPPPDPPSDLGSPDSDALLPPLAGPLSRTVSDWVTNADRVKR